MEPPCLVSFGSVFHRRPPRRCCRGEWQGALLREAELADLKPGCLVIDLASKPGGVDFDAAARLGVKAFWALSLPGKVAPVTAGKSIKTTIYNILTELGV